METSATVFLKDRNTPFSVHRYDYNPADGKIGLQAASAIGEDTGNVLKTLMVKVDKTQPICVVVPVDHKMNLKQIAALFGGRNAKMMAPEEAHELTGFQKGGTSPFGQKTQSPVVLAEQAMARDHVYINAGDQGLVVKIAPTDVCRAVDAIVGDISAP